MFYSKGLEQTQLKVTSAKW